MPLTLYKRGDIWHYRGTVAGRRIRGSAKTSDRKIAARLASEIEARHWKGHLDGPQAVLTFAQAAYLYRAAGKPTRFLDAVEDHFRDTLVRDIRPSAVRAAAITLCPTAGPATRNRHVIVPVQAIINHAAEAELCPPLKVKRFAVVTRRKQPASWEWIEAFMAHANPHLGALACFMFLTGARVTEAINVLWEDVDLTTRTALIRETKVNSERIAHLPAPLVVAISNIEGDRQGKVFKYSSRHTAKPQWEKAIKRAGIAPLTYHALRHGFATALLHKGIDPVTVAKLGGWKTPQHVFATYGHAMDDRTLTDLISGTPVTQTPIKKAK